MSTGLLCVGPFVNARFLALKFLFTLLLFLPAVSLQAAILNVDCSKKSLQAEISTRLDKTAINTVNISGSCAGNVLVSGHVNLTLAGATANATILGDAQGISTALRIEGSTVNVQGLTVDAEDSARGVECAGRSVCVLRNVNVLAGLVDGAIAVMAQDQSALDLIGTSTISGQRAAFGSGVGVFGASSVNIRPAWAAGFDPAEAGPTIAGHDIGVTAQDGSFLRTDNALITDNVSGVFAQRNATIKVLGNAPAGVVDNDGDGVFVNRAAVAQVGTPVSGNGGVGVYVGPLSLAQIQASISGNTNGSIFCEGPAAVVQGGNHACP